MKKKFYIILLILGIVAILVTVPVFWLTYAAPKDLEVNFLDVGQGDSILIKTPFGQNILIDGGSDSTIIKRLGESLAWWDKRIDLMVLSHPHDDHVAGLIDVIKQYNVEQILYTGVIHTSPTYLEWLELIRERKIFLVIIDRPQKISMGKNCYLDILYPQESLLGKEVNNLNNSSMVIKLVYGNTKFLFTGDVELEIEQQLIETQDFASLQADVFKAGHHGSDTSNSKEFLDAVSPKTVVIQVGKDNDFGHPSRRAIKRFERIGAMVYRNDLDGTIRIRSDGKEVYLEFNNNQ